MHKQVSTPVVVAVFAVVILVLIGLGYYFLRPKPYVPSPGVGGRPMELPNYGPPGGGGVAPPAGVRPGDVSAIQGGGAVPSYPPAPPSGVRPGDVTGAQGGGSVPAYPPPR